jgi:hypothetical protein
MLTQKLSQQLGNWNRIIHIYLGLYLLFFIWLLSVSGLLLNHPTWRIAQFWPDREQSSFEQVVHLREEMDDWEKANEVMLQLSISGEIEQIVSTEGFRVQVVKPGQIFNIRIIDPETNLAQVEVIQVNAWGVLHMLHSFTGVRIDNPKKQRDWIWTRVWSICLDAVAIGLVLLVISGIYMWYRGKTKKPVELACLVAGTVVCSFFLILGIF